MSAAALAAIPAAPHAQPQPAAAGVHPRGGGLTVRVPLRLVMGAQYGDAALSAYVKVAALALRPEGCTARVATLAAYLGMSKSAVERGLRDLRNPDEVDGLVEVPTIRRTLPGGRGESAHRVTRPLEADELWVRIPVRSAEALTPRLLRLYALLAYATARRIPMTVAELGQMLRHHTGQRAGECLGERQARRLVDELEGTGWLTVHRRQGERGRHAYETHRHPLRAVDSAAGATVIHDGSGAGDQDGSLASREDHLTDRPDETNPVGGSRRRRTTGSSPVENPDRPVHNVTGTFGPGASRAARGNRPTPTAAPANYNGPTLQLSPRVWRVLAPVRHELPGIRPFVLRRIARTIGEQLRTYADEERLAERIRRRYASVLRADIRDMGAWLLGTGIVHRGCGVSSCEDSTVWPTGAPCQICAHQRQVISAQWRVAREVQARLEQLQQDQHQDEHTQAAAGHELPPLLAPEEAAALPRKASYRQRDRASDAQIRRAIADHGKAGALHIYGHLRVLPLLADSPTPETGTDRRTHDQ
ncbi:hypothetical protein [Streptomyces sp. NPDC050264]|uniref:hypothetical protein n=1 Tax=Streptomyces sp. NPDC050264 TaxID=3155038 RepID=UPI0034334D98